MNYFDFHCHPTLKTTLKNGVQYNDLIPSNAVSGVVGCCTDLPQIIASQIGIKEVQDKSKFNKVVLGIALYAIEWAIAADETLNEVAQTNHGISKYLDVSVLKDIASNKIDGYSYLSNSLLPVFEQKPDFKILRSGADIDQLDENTIGIFFTIEGSHSLCSTNNQVFNPDEIIQNLRAIQQRVKVISLNITHLQPSNICNPAFGIQLTNNKRFIPTGNGLSTAGERVITECFKQNTCVDIKHMSLFARTQLMQQMQNNHYENAQPLICTHAGFTGMKIADFPDFVAGVSTYSKARCVEVIHTKPMHVDDNFNIKRPSPCFNASTINLFDDEILFIVRNGGLIGLSMDRRICGYVDRFDDHPYEPIEDDVLVVDREFFSLQEFQSLQQYLNVKLEDDFVGQKANSARCLLKDDLEEATNLPSNTQDYHRQHSMLQVMHFLQVCYDGGIAIADAQKRICIGSDFDGLINPFYSSMVVNDLVSLKKYFLDNFSFFLEQYSESINWKNQLDIPSFLENLFYNNGIEFLRSRL